MLLLVEKGSRDGICCAIHRYVNANNKYMKDYDESKESSYLNYWDVNNFEWIEEFSQFSKDFIKSYNQKKSWRIFSWSWCSIPIKITWVL